MARNGLSSLLVDCSKCRVCKGSGLQAPPALYAGNIDNPIAVVGQNPGWISNPGFLLSTANQMLRVSESNYEPQIIGDLIGDWYYNDITGSNGYQRLGDVLGEGWLEAGRFFFTNAVRCRTMDNETPSREMVLNCSVFSENLLSRNSVKAIIFIGRIAVEQYLGVDAIKLPAGTVKKAKGKILLALPHYAVWKKDEISGFAELVNKINENIG